MHLSVHYNVNRLVFAGAGRDDTVKMQKYGEIDQLEFHPTGTTRLRAIFIFHDFDAGHGGLAQFSDPVSEIQYQIIIFDLRCVWIETFTHTFKKPIAIREGIMRADPLFNTYASRRVFSEKDVPDIRVVQFVA